MRANRTHLFALTGVALTLLVVGCSQRFRPASVEPGGEYGLQAYTASQVDREPKLIKCAEFHGPPASSVSGGRWAYVTLGFIVTETGSVDAKSIFVKSAARRPSQPDASQKVIHDAEQIALTCEYEPGLLGGQPVRVATERRFRILAEI